MDDSIARNNLHSRFHKNLCTGLELNISLTLNAWCWCKTQSLSTTQTAQLFNRCSKLFIDKSRLMKYWSDWLYKITILKSTCTHRVQLRGILTVATGTSLYRASRSASPLRPTHLLVGHGLTRSGVDMVMSPIAAEPERRPAEAAASGCTAIYPTRRSRSS